MHRFVRCSVGSVILKVGPISGPGGPPHGGSRQNRTHTHFSMSGHGRSSYHGTTSSGNTQYVNSSGNVRPFDFSCFHVSQSRLLQVPAFTCDKPITTCSVFCALDVTDRYTPRIQTVATHTATATGPATTPPPVAQVSTRVEARGLVKVFIK